MSGTHDCGGDAAAYVLGALEPAEAEAFQRHLEGCAVCRDEVDALEGVVQALPMTAPQVQPPRRLRRRVIRAVRAEPRTSAGGAGRRRPKIRIRRSALAALGAAAVAAGAGVASLELAGGGFAGRIIAARVSGIFGSAELRLSGDHGELILRHLTPPPAGHVYEVWLKAAHAQPIPASVLFSVGSSGNVDVGLPESLRGESQVMVTPEPEGGSPVPTHSPVIVAALT